MSNSTTGADAVDQAIAKGVDLDGSPIPADLTFPAKFLWQAANLHKGRVILTNRATELEYQWKSDDDVRDSPPNKQQPPLPKQQ